MKSRLALPEMAQLDATQRAIYDDIMASRGNVDGPFLAWLHAPAVAEPAQRLGAVCRYKTSLALLESELLILTVAARHQCVGERQIHEPIAREAGLSPAVIEAIAQGQEPMLAEPRQKLLWRLADSLLDTHRIPQALYDEALAAFGAATLVEIVSILGYYAFVAMTLNAFEMRKD